MKYIILVPDGAADEPVEALGGRTPLAAARTPNMDYLARHGLSGMVTIIPPGMNPGSDVGNLSMMGYDPRGVLSGRAPLEAANLGISLAPGDIAFRCNLVTVQDGVMVDYSAGHISVAEADAIMKDLKGQLSSDTITYYTGKSYRHIAVIKSSLVAGLLGTACTPPHDILTRPIAGHLPKGPAAKFLLEQMELSKPLLAAHPVNQARIREGKLPAVMTWFWGQGPAIDLPSYEKKFGIKGGVISAVDLVNGIGRLVGLKVIAVPGVTGYLDTNFKGKAEYAIASLKDHDFVFVHVEATDETGHNGDAAGKVQAVERFDADVLGPVLAWAKGRDDVRLLISPDHATPLSRRTHTSGPVPFVMYGKGIEPNGRDRYNEALASATGLAFSSGEEMVGYFMGRTGA
jgi:2,3-bisphosphoglycerate-independent phosphoglycerate mutase